jgi:3-dehydroquinate synthase
MQLQVEVSLGSRSYRVLIGPGVLKMLPELARQNALGSSYAMISDTNVAPLYSKTLNDTLKNDGFRGTVITVPAGETSKSLQQVENVCQQMVEARLDRGSFVIALGGGVIGDLAGFVAAIYQRGIPCVQAPTTIVAQVDSAIGGKTGVNLLAGKNLVGAFHQPSFVVADTETLRTLPEREFNEGFAEIIKHAIIRDREMFESLEKIERETLEHLIARNVKIKAQIVSSDERETSGERAILNFGHTIGHAIENAAGYGRYLHGEAISLGIAAASTISMRAAGLSAAERERIVERLQQFGLPTKLDASVSMEAIMKALLSDKKFVDGNVRFVLCPKIGEAFVSSDVTLEMIREAIDGLRHRHL